MQNLVAVIGWIEVVGILVIILTILGANQIVKLLNGMKHGIDEFKKATREVQEEVAEALETKAIDDEGRGFRRYGFKFWFIVSLGVGALWAGALWLRQLLA